jgi:hypothetical protein
MAIEALVFTSSKSRMSPMLGGQEGAVGSHDDLSTGLNTAGFGPASGEESHWRCVQRAGDEGIVAVRVVGCLSCLSAFLRASLF